VTESATTPTEPEVQVQENPVDLSENEEETTSSETLPQDSSDILSTDNDNSTDSESVIDPETDTPSESANATDTEPDSKRHPGAITIDSRSCIFSLQRTLHDNHMFSKSQLQTRPLDTRLHMLQPERMLSNNACYTEYSCVSGPTKLCYNGGWIDVLNYEVNCVDDIDNDCDAL